MTSAAPPTDFFPGINFNPSFYNLGSSAVTLDYLNSNFLRSTGYAISRAQYTLFNGSVNIQQNLDVSQNINASAYFLNNVPISFSQWTTSGNDIYYNTGNVGIGKTNPNSIYKLDVSGNINADKIFRAGTELTQYTDANTRTVLSNSAGTNMTWNTSTLKFDVAAPYTDANTRTVLSNSAGTNMTWNTSTLKFDVAAPYTDANTRTVLSNSAGTNMTWNTSTLKFDVTTSTYTLPTASTTTLGGVRIDGTSININSGVISLSGNDIILTGGTNNRSYGWTGATSLLGRVGTAGNYSTGSLVEDIVLRSQGRLVLQSGTTNPAMTIDTSNNVGIGTTTPNYKLDVNGTMNAIIYRTNGVLTSHWLAVGTNICNSNTGNIGFGIDTPASLLHLQKSALNQEVKIQLTDNSTGFTATDGLAIYKGTDHNGYFWNYENNALIFGTNNTEKMRILSNGNVSIGTNSPSSLLHLHTSTINTLVRLQITDSTTGTGTTDGLAIYKGTDQHGYFMNYENNALIFGTNNSEKMRILANGNIGIGNTDPIAPLTIGNAALANNDGFIVLEKCTVVGATRQFRIGLNAAFDLAMGDYGANNIAGTWLEAFKISYTAPTNSLVIGGSGNVSMIGQLNLPADINAIVSGGRGRVYYINNGGTIYYGNGTGDIHQFRNSANNNVLTIRDDGLHSISGFLTCTNYVLANGRVYSRNGGFDTWLYSDSAGMYLNMGNQSTENAPSYLKIGAYNGATYIESNQQRNIIFKIYVSIFSGTAPRWEFNTNYNCFNANNSTSWNQVCDQRMKENIIKADLKICYNNVKNINLYRYKFIDAFDNEYSDKNRLGYIAQEVKKYFPKATYTQKKRLNDNREIPDLLSIDVDQINLTLYGAVKQLIKVVEKQNKRIKALEALLNIEDNDDIDDDAGEAYVRIYDENECNIDDIEPSEPSNEV